MITAFDTIDWKQEEYEDTFINLNIDHIVEGFVSQKKDPFDFTQPKTIELPLSSYFFQYNNLAPNKPVQVGIYCRSLSLYSGEFNLLHMVNDAVFDVLQMDVMVANEYVSAYTYSAYTTVATKKGQILKAAIPSTLLHPLPAHITNALTYSDSPVFDALEKCPGLTNKILEPYHSAVKLVIEILSSDFITRTARDARRRKVMERYAAQGRYAKIYTEFYPADMH